MIGGNEIMAAIVWMFKKQSGQIHAGSPER